MAPRETTLKCSQLDHLLCNPLTEAGYNSDAGEWPRNDLYDGFWFLKYQDINTSY